MARRPLEQLSQKHPLTLAVSLDELSHLNDLADSLNVSRHALGLRLLRLGLEHFKAEHPGNIHQAQR